MLRRTLLASLLLAGVALVPARILSQTAGSITTPRQAFGANIGDDYFLVTYTQLEDYWHALQRQSDRMRLVDIGPTTEGRRQWMAVVTAPENLARLDEYRSIARRLALADDLDEGGARALASRGKAIVWIDGGLHADETLGAQQLIELVYQLVSRSDPETLRILHDTIVLAVPANPDGQELVASWYMRHRDPHQRSLEGLPRLYQQYIGHDNNRDFYMGTQAETINMARVLYREWFPQIVYDHHQPAPPGTAMFAPPFGGPVSVLFDPLLASSIDAVGDALQQRFSAEGKPGVTMRSGSAYSNWWNGGLRTTANFHNQIGILTETVGEPGPTNIPYVAERQTSSADLPMPIRPQPWRFRQSVAYSMTANRAVLDFASRHHEQLLFNIYRMGRNGIERGNRDFWTRPRPPGLSRERDLARRDARAYIIPADQSDFPTAVRFVDALLKTGVRVLRATAPFQVGARTYPAGTLVISTAQAFRAHVLDMFEPQDYPWDERQGVGRPYDKAGWTLSFQMGVQFDRVLDAVDGPFESLTSVAVPAGRISGVTGAAGYLFSHRQNNAFIVLNRLMAAGDQVYWVAAPVAVGPAADTGATIGEMYVAARPSTRSLLERLAAETGVSFTGVAAPPFGEALRIRPTRVALWDQYGGSVASGWTRWILERFSFPFERVYAQTLDAGNLASRYDVIILPDDAVPSLRSIRDEGTGIEALPPEYRSTTGTISWTRTVPELKRFVEAGGTLLLVGGATRIGQHLGAPLVDALLTDDGRRVRPQDEVDVPGSVLQVRVDATTPLAYGFAPQVNVFFDNSPVFRIVPGPPVSSASRNSTPAAAARRVAWFDSPTPLRSGFARGQQHLAGGVVVADVALGKGRIAMFGPEVTFRAQSQGTFKFLFNAIFYGQAQVVGRAGRTE